MPPRGNQLIGPSKLSVSPAILYVQEARMQHSSSDHEAEMGARSANLQLVNTN